MKQSKIFISYSHRGNGLAWKDRLIDALAVFEKHHLLDIWHDEEMALGENWHERIKDSMRSSRLAILLLTDEMLKSPFVLQHEFPELKRRHESEGLIIAPILCEKCDWAANEWVASLQIKPRVQTDPTPLADLSKRDSDRALRKIATEIAEQISHATLTALPKPIAPLSPDRIYLDKFPLSRGPGLREEKLIGREQELAVLDLAFAQPHTAIVTLVAWGGVGKTMLVQHWLQRLQHEDWYGVQRVYAWSFYSQGTTEDRQASEDTFLAHALGWFGVQCEPTLLPWDKGRLLTQALVNEPTLLILDGIEPLQYPPGPMGGQLRAPGIQSLLKQLARKAGDTAYPCLCLVTTREPLTDLSDFERRPEAARGSVLRLDLGNLTEEAGAALLHHAGAKRAGAVEIKNDDSELLAASREVDGHALTLNLLGRFVARAHGGDIRRRDLVKFEVADRMEQGGTTFKMLAAFENWFANEGDIEARGLTILRLLGLFDRPADSGCLSSLREPPIIAGLTEPLFVLKRDLETGQINEQPLSDKAWNDAVHFLADFGLVVIHVGMNDAEGLLDCHPLVREYFATKFRSKEENSWIDSHSRIYQYLKSNSPEYPEFIETLQPLYCAVRHGCKAGKIHAACDEIFYGRIRRGEKKYSWLELCAFHDDLTALASFFITPWSSVSQVLSESDKCWVLAESAFCLRWVGRLVESIWPMEAAMELSLLLKEYKNASADAVNLSESFLILGEVGNSIKFGKIAVEIGMRSEDWDSYRDALTTLGDAQHQAGFFVNALEKFKSAEKWNSTFNRIPLLYGVTGFQYCDLLLSQTEQSAWHCFVYLRKQEISYAADSGIFDASLALCDEVKTRGTTTCRFYAEFFPTSIDVGVDYLTLCRVSLYQYIFDLSPSKLSVSAQEYINDQIEQAKNSFIKTGNIYFLPCYFLTSSWLNILKDDISSARSDLDEAWDIAQRGPMRLHMADIHLYRARLFFREEHYPWESPQADLAAAEKLINECGYHRRDEELADAKKAILSV